MAAEHGRSLKVHMDDLAFYIFAAISVGSAFGVVVSQNIVRTALFLLGTLGGVAGLYFLLDANLIAVIQLIVYAGGTLILIVFGIMLTSKSPWAEFKPPKGQIVLAALVGLLMFIGITSLTLSGDVNWAARATKTPLATSPKVAEAGEALLTTYLVPFEVASVLLLVVMIGAAYLAKTEK